MSERLHSSRRVSEHRAVWSLTLPQVAATLAATLVAYNTFDSAGHRLLDDTMLNAVLVMLVTTSILGPVLRQRYAPRMLESPHIGAAPDKPGG